MEFGIRIATLKVHFYGNRINVNWIDFPGLIFAISGIAGFLGALTGLRGGDHAGFDSCFWRRHTLRDRGDSGVAYHDGPGQCEIPFKVLGANSWLWARFEMSETSAPMPACRPERPCLHEQSEYGDDLYNQFSSIPQLGAEDIPDELAGLFDFLYRQRTEDLFPLPARGHDSCVP